MKFGLGLSLSKGGNGGSGSPPSAPTALAATSNTTGIAFTANLSAGANNTGTYYIDVFYADGITPVGTWTNTSFTGLSKVIDSGLWGLTEFRYQIRSQLNTVVVPMEKLDADYDHVLTYSGANTLTGIKNFAQAISDASSTNTYLIKIPSGTYSDSGVSITGFSSYISFKGAGVSQTTLQSTGNVVIFDCHATTLEIADLNMISDRWSVHTDTTYGACKKVIRRCNMASTGTLWGMATGFYNNQYTYIVDCNISNVIGDVFLTHNHVTADQDGTDHGGGVFVLWNCNFTAGDGTGQVVFENRANTGVADLFYLYGGNCPRFEETSFSGTGSYFIDPSITCVKTLADPSLELTTVTLPTYIVTNDLIHSDNSNMVSVTTASEGSRAIDNIPSVSNPITSYIPFAASTLQIKTPYAGSLVSDNTDTNPVTTWYDQSLNGRDATGITTARPTYAANGMGIGIPALHGINSPVTLMSLLAAINLGTNYDLIVVTKMTTKLVMFANSNVPGIMYLSSNGTMYHFTTASGNVNNAHSISLNVNHYIRVRRRGTSVKFYVDSLTEFFSGTLGSNNASAFQYLFSDLHGDNPDANVSEVVPILGTDDTLVANYAGTIQPRFATA